jgi:hypothetical protein
MKNILITVLLFVTSLTSHGQNNLVFDNGFNNNSLHLDNFASANQSVDSYGGLKQLNDSTFVYFVNKLDSVSKGLNSRAIVKTIRPNGTVYEEWLCDFNPVTFNNPANSFHITDVIVSPSDNQIFVVKNSIHNPSGTQEKRIHVLAYTYSNSYWNLNPVWGSNGITYVEVPGTDCKNAKGTMSSNTIALAFEIGNTNTNVGFTILSNNGFITHSLLTNNISSMSSKVAAIVHENFNVYIADNAAVSFGVNQFDDFARVIKFDISNGVLDPNFNGGGISGSMTWNSSSLTPEPQDYITQLLLDNTGGNLNLFISGYSKIDNGQGVYYPQGRVSKMGALSGILSSTFASNGNFNTDLSSDYETWSFNDIDKGEDGNFYLSCNGTEQIGITNPKGFLIPISYWGNMLTSMGSNGLLYESDDLLEINQTVITPSNSFGLQEKFVVHGISNPINMLDSTSAIGRLKMNTSVGIIEPINSFTISPNPSNTDFWIKSTLVQEVTIYNISGQKILTLAGSIIYKINSSNWPNGIYFIQAENGSTQKFIKN